MPETLLWLTTQVQSSYSIQQIAALAVPAFATLSHSLAVGSLAARNGAREPELQYWFFVELGRSRGQLTLKRSTDNGQEENT